MKYILPIMPLYLYFELLGMAILDYLKIKRYTFSFGIGLAVFLGAMFIIHIPLVLLEASYLLLVIVTLLLLIIGLIFIDYNNVVKYLLESDYNFLILDKNIDYSDYEGHYLSIYHKILESEIYLVYENETYAIFHFEK